MHLFGHSWGGLLAQFYLVTHPDRVASLFLCNSSTGARREWKTMETALMRYNRSRVGALGWTIMGLLSTLSRAPGSLGRWAPRR